MKKLICFVLALLVMAACSPPTNEQALVAETKMVETFFVTDTPRGFKLVSELREFESTQGGFPTEVLSQLISGELQPLDPDYVNLWDNSNSLNQVVLSGATATIDINLGKLNVGSEGEIRAIDQLVWTLTGVSSFLTTVRFLVNGEVVESFAGHVDTTADFQRSPDYEVLNPLQIDSINEGATVSNPITISGKACTFEANVVWELTQGDQLVSKGFTTAAVACPQRSAWSVTLDQLAPGNYVFAAQEFSAEDGSLFAVDTKSFVVK